MTTFTETWSGAYEGLPPDTVEPAAQGATRIRSLKLAVRERLAVDHSIAGDGHDGKHNKVTLRVQGGDPTLDSGDGALYTKAVSGVNELFMKDSAGRVFQLTVLGALSSWTTGDVKVTFKIAADTGWVMMDDGTIGSAGSGGTTRANADTEALFTLLWTVTVDADCAVSGGRGASAAADFAANKTIALPKALGRELAIAGAGSGLTSRALASVLGTETKTIGTTHLPASGLTIPSLTVNSHVHQQQLGDGTNTPARLGTGDSVPTVSVGPTGVLKDSDIGPSLTLGAGSTTVANTTSNMGAGNALDVMTPRFHAKVMIKL